MTTLQELTAKRQIRWGGTVVGTVLVVTAVGMLPSPRLPAPLPAAAQVRGAAPVRAAAPAAVPRPPSFRISDDIRTSFGIVAVEFVRSVDGSTHRALPATSRGTSGPAHSGARHIQVAVALTNQTRQPMRYSVRQFSLDVTASGRTSALAATTTDLPDGRILPDAGIEGHLDFTVPGPQSAISLSFRDPGSSAPIVIDLGPVVPTTAPVR